jgi:hypothetical protein
MSPNLAQCVVLAWIRLIQPIQFASDHLWYAVHITPPCSRLFLSIVTRFLKRASFPIVCLRPTQSMMYVPLQVNRCQNCILLIVEYNYLKSIAKDIYFPESYPPHKIMLYWFYYSMSLVFHFNLTTLVQKGWQELHRRQASFFLFACSPYDWY